jgi:hypothetical protein
MNRVALFARPSLAVIYLATAQRSTLPAPLPLRQQRRAIVEYAQRTHRSVVAQVVESRRRSTAGGFARLRDLIKDLALGIRYPNVDTVLVHDAHGFGGHGRGERRDP